MAGTECSNSEEHKTPTNSPISPRTKHSIECVLLGVLFGVSNFLTLPISCKKSAYIGPSEQSKSTFYRETENHTDYPCMCKCVRQRARSRSSTPSEIDSEWDRRQRRQRRWTHQQQQHRYIVGYPVNARTFDFSVTKTFDEDSVERMLCLRVVLDFIWFSTRTKTFNSHSGS